AEEKKLYPNNNSAAAPTSGNGGGWKNYLIVKVVNGENWTTEDWVYKIDPNNWNKTIKLNEKPGGGSIDTTCVGLARSMAKYAEDVKNDAASIIATGGDPADKYASIIRTPGQSGSTDAGNSVDPEASASNCVVEGLGWIVCPV